MLLDKNLIGLKQLRLDEVSGYMLLVSSGYLATVSGSLVGYIDARDAAVSGYAQNLVASLSGNLSTAFAALATGVQFNLASGIDTIDCSFGGSFGTTPKPAAQIGSTLTTDPILVTIARAPSSTGVTIELSDITRSTGYYLFLQVQR